MIGVYGVFVNGGVVNKFYIIRKIIDSSDCCDCNNIYICCCIYLYILDINCENFKGDI